MFMFLFFILILTNAFAEKKLIIKYAPSKIFNSNLDFINESGYDRYSTFIESLEKKGRKVFFEYKIPKTGVIEGEYQLLIIEDNKCMGNYIIIGDDYVYNVDKGYYQKNVNILNDLRAILYIEYLRKLTKS